ncbi:hypothetical protein GTP55_09385 [Duganella sp. FT109W]|uniref:Uncharacterized protein n=1 Tax=Duganella margarita TaxID=2692170 RepID=A0ABW9WEX2_9BURK|nr:hypothetical protein [Duganella margarita]MYN39583.1 hypothetical protein [Duganella margarita]
MPFLVHIITFSGRRRRPRGAKRRERITLAAILIDYCFQYITDVKVNGSGLEMLKLTDTEATAGKYRLRRPKIQQNADADIIFIK